MTSVKDTYLEEGLLVVPHAVTALLMRPGVGCIWLEPGLVALLGAVPDLLLHSRDQADGQPQLVLPPCSRTIDISPSPHRDKLQCSKMQGACLPVGNLSALQACQVMLPDKHLHVGMASKPALGQQIDSQRQLVAALQQHHRRHSGAHTC